jgi:hypothetical protein
MDATAPKKLDTSGLKKFAQAARRTLIDQVSSKLDQVLSDGSAARREQPQAVKELEKEIANDGREQVVERVAYTWFNRFSALRFMDANGYTRIRVVSPADGQTRPEILAEAAAGHIDEDVPEAARQKVSALLEGRSPSREPQGESYRLLLVAACNGWHGVMPFLFEKIADYTELLMPDDLLSADSILARMREVMTEDACRDVEIIGWLYQFYISEKKDEVFAGLKKNKKITPENIPAATQLFTPHWIVRYLVENSLGRLWMLNRPNSRLRERMDYYIAPEQPEEEFLRVSSSEEIKVCDPACGSGHMLTYAFDLLYAIYEEEGYDTSEIPGLILRKNLYGIEIDDRAGALAAFALMMKARGVQRRFFGRDLKPNISVLENVSFEAGELAEYTAAVGRDLFTADLRETLGQFAEVKNFGSLIEPKLKEVSEVARVVSAKKFEGNLFLRDVHARVGSVLRMSDYLSPQYHVVVANPPYLGGKGMNSKLGDWLKDNYPTGKADLFASFIERGRSLTVCNGYNAMVTMESWMFLSSFEKLRLVVQETSTISTLLHMPYLGKGGTSMGISFGTAAFVLQNKASKNLTGEYVCVRYYETDDFGVPFEFPVENERRSQASIADFEKIPGSPIAYWVSDGVRNAFQANPSLGDYLTPAVGQNTGDNDRFLRLWHETSLGRIGFGYKTMEEAASSGLKWFPYNKGGPYRKWFGNAFYVVNWENDGQEIKDYAVYRNKGKHWSRYIQNLHFMLKEGVSWTATSSSYFGCRYTDPGFLFDVKGTSGFSDNLDSKVAAAYLATKGVTDFLMFLNPTIEFQSRDIRNLPFNPDLATNSQLLELSHRAVALSRSDWNAYETSWDFTVLPLLSPDHRGETLEDSYAILRAHWQSMTVEMTALEEENNRIFIDAYGLQDELSPEGPIEEITLTCNPSYRYGVKGTQEDRETRLRSDTMAEFLSYAVGCMFGRYSLDAPGLILANQREGFEDYLKRVPEPSFPPDRDNVIPVLDGDWFADDIADRFRRFLRVTFGEEHFAENLAFIETALGKDIRRYFLRDFYDDHIRRYKKRPIYWMFSSPKGSFNALIYMHRYRPDTVGVVLNGYLREYRSKLAAHRAQLETVSISADASQAEKTKALKEIERLGTVIEELDVYEREVLYPLATRRIEIDLDDGLKVNYAKFGNALKPIKGLSDAED